MEQLTAEIDGADNYRRYAAVSELYAIAFNTPNQKIPEAAWALRRVLNDPDKSVRYLSCIAIARLGTPEALATLEEASKGESGDQATYFLKLARDGKMNY